MKMLKRADSLKPLGGYLDPEYGLVVTYVHGPKTL